MDPEYQAAKALMDQQSVPALLNGLDTPATAAFRASDSAARLLRMNHARLRDEEAALTSLSLSELYTLSLGDGSTSSNYQRQRAKELVSISLVHIEHSLRVDE